jgi:hypothetical protein
MKYTDKVKVDEAATIGQVRTVVDVITGIGRLTSTETPGWDNPFTGATIGFEVDSEDEETPFDFGVRMAGFADELAAYGCHIEPSFDKVTK